MTRPGTLIAFAVLALAACRSTMDLPSGYVTIPPEDGAESSAVSPAGNRIVVRRHEIDYIRPALLGDSIELTTWIEKWRGASSVRCTSITRAADGEELARSKTTWVMVHAAGGRPCRIPATLIEDFERGIEVLLIIGGHEEDGTLTIM